MAWLKGIFCSIRFRVFFLSLLKLIHGILFDNQKKNLLRNTLKSCLILKKIKNKQTKIEEDLAREESQIEMRRERQQQQSLKKSANSMRRSTGDATTTSVINNTNDPKEVKFMSFVKKIEDLNHSVPATVENSEVIRQIVSGEKVGSGEHDKKSIAFTTSEEQNQDETTTTSTSLAGAGGKTTTTTTT